MRSALLAAMVVMASSVGVCAWAGCGSGTEWDSSDFDVLETCADEGGMVTVVLNRGTEVICASGTSARLWLEGSGGVTYPLVSSGSDPRRATGIVPGGVPAGTYTVKLQCEAGSANPDPETYTLESIQVPCAKDAGAPDARPDGQTDPDAGGDGGALKVTGTAYCVMSSNMQIASICGGEILKPMTPQHESTLAATVAFEKSRATPAGLPALGTCGPKMPVLPPFGMVPNADVGMKIVVNGNAAFLFDIPRIGNGSYYATPPAPAPYGKAITFDFPGGADLMAKSGVAVGTAPPQIVVSGPSNLVLSTSGNTTITWTPFAAPTFYLDFMTAGRACRFDPMAGTGTIPAAFTAMLPANGQAKFVAASWVEAPLGNGTALGVSLLEEDSRSYSKQ